MNKKVLIAADIHDYLTEQLIAHGYELIHLNNDDQQVLVNISEFEGIITSNKLEIDRKLLDKASKLKWIGRMGSGMEIIDVAYATSKGIKCYSSPEGNANAVAEQALGVLLCLQHQVFKAQCDIENQLWLRAENSGVEIEGLTAAIIGLGNNGLLFAKKLVAMGVHVLGYDKYKTNLQEPGITICPDLAAIYEQADIISFHVPLTAETKHYFNAGFLGHMKKPFVLLNLSRGPVVSITDLYAAMKAGKVTAASLDVWEKEPYWLMQPDQKAAAEALMSMTNFIGTPHIGGYSRQAAYKMSYYLANKIFTQ